MATQTEKYVWLVSLFQRKGALTFKEISAEWEQSELNNKRQADCPERGEALSRSTFNDWLRNILMEFGINIECNRKGGYQYYIANGDSLSENRVQAWMLNSMTLSNMLQENRAIYDRIIPEAVPSSQHFLPIILEAMRENRVLEVTYQAFDKSEAHTFLSAPYFVKLFKQRWYAVLLNLDYNSLRTYALDRIQAVRIAEPAQTFKMPKNLSADEYFTGCAGIIREEDVPIQKVKIKVTAQQSRYLREVPLHDSQQESRIDDEYNLFTYRVRPSFDFRQSLLALGSSIEVLSPAWYREEIAEEIHAMNEKYAKK